MNYIKLDATTSTNDYLKRLISQQIVDNFTVVVTENQTEGKGQRGSTWDSEAGKNLTFSILIKDLLLDIKQIYLLNVAISVAILQVLTGKKIPELAVKWPNDIMSENYKIGGILIENSIKSNGEIESIVGIGLNINQKYFSRSYKASSLFLQTNIIFDKETLLILLVEEINRNCLKIMQNQKETLWHLYQKQLYKKGMPMPFENDEMSKFMGIIQKVTLDGKLELLLEDDTIKNFNIKELKMLY